MNRRELMRVLLGALMALPVGTALARPDNGHSASDRPVPVALLRHEYPLPPRDVDLIGRFQRVAVFPGDTLLDIGRRHGIGFEAMRMANPGVDLFVPEVGRDVLVPTRFILPQAPREGLIINLPEMRLYYYPPPARGAVRTVETYAISIGRMDWATPVGVTRVVNRIEQPDWFPPESVRQRVLREEGTVLPRRVPPGPDNPLGDYAVGLDIPGYFIHGTNRPYGVGMRASAGCIRMYPEDIASLVYRLPVGTQVRIINEPYKVGSALGRMFVQAFPVLEEDREAWAGKGYQRAVDVLGELLERRPIRIDYTRLKAVVDDANGLVTDITRSG